MNSRKSKVDRKKVLELNRKGLSLREIGKLLDCSHQSVKRCLESEYPKANQALYEWASGEFLTRSKVVTHLRQISKNGRWNHLPKELLQEWEKQILDALRRPDGKDEVGLLLAIGPKRRGRPVKSASGILRDENGWNSRESKFTVMSSIGKNGFDPNQIRADHHNIIR